MAERATLDKGNVGFAELKADAAMALGEATRAAAAIVSGFVGTGLGGIDAGGGRRIWAHSSCAACMGESLLARSC